jgi:hypothetical protein
MEIHVFKILVQKDEAVLLDTMEVLGRRESTASTHS